MAGIERKLNATLENERRKRDHNQATRLAQVGARFERLVESGAIEVERYNLGSTATFSIMPPR